MKTKLITLLVSLALSLPVFAAEPAKPGAPQTGASSLLIDALRSLSGLLPKPEAPRNEGGAVATLGIRGNESTATLITPYWKDDRSNDPAFKAQLEAYLAAHNLLQAQRWDAAQQAMVGFLGEHPNSDLTPHARFGQALAVAGAGNGAAAASQFQQFARDYPQHPLRGEAERLATALRAAQ